MKIVNQSIAKEFDLLAEGLRCKNALQAFTADVTERLGVSSQDLLALVKSDRSKGDKNIYFYFPFNFAQGFEVEISHLRALSFAGMLFMSYARFQDDAIDGAGRPSITQLLLKDVYLIEFFQRLYQIFPAASPFWTMFSRYHDEFTSAVLLEKQLSKAGAAARYTDDDYQRIARGKAAMAKCSVAALGVLSGQEDRIPALERAIDCYHLAYQRYDDIIDWKADVQNSAYTQVLAAIYDKMPPAERSCSLEDRLDTMSHLLHYAGIADQQLTQAWDACNEAYEMAMTWGCRIYAGAVQRLQTRIVALRTDLRVIVQKNILQSTGLTDGASPHPLIAHRGAPAFHSHADISDAIASGLAFIGGRQREDGSLVDFLHGGTRSEEWTMGYVGLMLKKLPAAEALMQATARELIRRQDAEGGWGWNRTITPVDADSTSCAMLFLDGHPEFQPGDQARAAARLKTYKHPSGGYSTYVDGPALRQFLGKTHPKNGSVKGWCSPQTCVTAMAIGAQLTSDPVEEVASSIEYLRSCQRPEGYWDAYWWDGSYYGTYHALRILTAFGTSEDQPRIRRAVDWLLAAQEEEGCWGSDTLGKNLPFHTAWCSAALALAEPSRIAVPAIQRGAAWLLQHQLTDGSWSPMRILRIPRPDSLTPWTRAEWKESPTDLNVLLRDDHALFTTSTVLHCLDLVNRAAAL